MCGRRSLGADVRWMAGETWPLQCVKEEFIDETGLRRSPERRVAFDGHIRGRERSGMGVSTRVLTVMAASSASGVYWPDGAVGWC